MIIIITALFALHFIAETMHKVNSNHNIRSVKLLKKKLQKYSKNNPPGRILDVNDWHAHFVTKWMLRWPRLQVVPRREKWLLRNDNDRRTPIKPKPQSQNEGNFEAFDFIVVHIKLALSLGLGLCKWRFLELENNPLPFYSMAQIPPHH